MSEIEVSLTVREIPLDWESLEDAFENNAREVHSYLHLTTGEVLRVVDGVADPQMHSRIAADGQYLRIDPVNSREQYRWMERFIPIVENAELKEKLLQAIDGKGAFRRFKDALVNYAEDRDRWFVFRGERLRTFIEAWLAAYGIKATALPQWTNSPPPSVADPDSVQSTGPQSELDPPKSSLARRARSAEVMRTQLKEISESLGIRELDTLSAFAEFLKARRAARGFAHHYEHQIQEREKQRNPESGLPFEKALGEE